MIDKFRAESQITFLYYADLVAASAFYEELMEFKLVEDQGGAKIYRVSGNAYMGIVDEKFGYHKTRPANALLFTLVVDDVEQSYAYLKAKGVTVLDELTPAGTSKIRRFVIQDPGEYTIEVQQFLEPESVKIFQGGN